MPTISVKRDVLFEALGKKYTDDEFQNLCFQFGLELDEVTTEKQMMVKEQGEQAGAGTSEEILYRIDIPANRYDLLCLEGLVTGLLVFLGKISPPNYRLQRAEDHHSLHLTPATALVRPYAVAAVLKGITFTKETYNSFIDLQESRNLKLKNDNASTAFSIPRGGTSPDEDRNCSTLLTDLRLEPLAPYQLVIDVLNGSLILKQHDKLHQNICRKRNLVAIGTHDIDTVQGPFIYDALPPQDIKFKALNQQKEMTAPELMELYSTHAQLKQYLDIIRDSPVYPIIKDKNGTILSMPPIINGDHSKITLDTKNVFIECTATDLTKAIVVLDTLVCMFSQYCNDKYEVQQCKVYAPDGTYQLYPKMEYREETINVEKANKYIGIDCDAEALAQLLSRMCLVSVATAGEGAGTGDVRARVPPSRHDVIHACDLYEDIAIAYGYNRIPRRRSAVCTVGAQVPLAKLTEQLRAECSRAAYTEALTFTLCSREDISSKLGTTIEKVPAVHISNPKTLEFQVVRTLLLPGLLKTLAANKKMPLPLQLFEISDVVVKDAHAETGARNVRHVCGVVCGRTAGFQRVHGLLDRLMMLLRTPRHVVDGYALTPAQDPAYFPGRCAEVTLRGKAIGKIGVLHPDVLAAFELTNPCSALEINIEPLL